MSRKLIGQYYRFVEVRIVSGELNHFVANPYGVGRYALGAGERQKRHRDDEQRQEQCRANIDAAPSRILRWALSMAMAIAPRLITWGIGDCFCLKQSWSYFTSRGKSCPDFDTGFPGLPENGMRSCWASLLASALDRLISPSLCTADTTARTSAG
jgi:hypothetical protein